MGYLEEVAELSQWKENWTVPDMHPPSKNALVSLIIKETLQSLYDAYVKQLNVIIDYNTNYLKVGGDKPYLTSVALDKADAQDHLDNTHFLNGVHMTFYDKFNMALIGNILFHLASTNASLEEMEVWEDRFLNLHTDEGVCRSLPGIRLPILFAPKENATIQINMARVGNTKINNDVYTNIVYGDPYDVEAVADLYIRLIKKGFIHAKEQRKYSVDPLRAHYLPADSEIFYDEYKLYLKDTKVVTFDFKNITEQSVGKLLKKHKVRQLFVKALEKVAPTGDFIKYSPIIFFNKQGKDVFKKWIN